MAYNFEYKGVSFLFDVHQTEFSLYSKKFFTILKRKYHSRIIQSCHKGKE